MSFTCGRCDKAQLSGITPNRIITKSRKAIYKRRTDTRGNIIDKGGVGREPVKEINMCQECYNVYQQNQ